MNFKQFVKDNKFNFVVLLIYLFITVYVMFFHEVWKDEAQVYCLIRDCSFLEIIKAIKVEGHPFLWYLILFPFAKCGCSVIVMQLISLFIVFASVVLLLFKSPFNRFEKIITVFSVGLIYYLPIVSRNYALIPLILFLIASLWNKKYERPFVFTFLIFLLSQTHLYLEGAAFGIFCIFAFGLINKFKQEKKFIYLFPVIFLLINFALTALFFAPSSELNYALTEQKNNMKSPLTVFFILQRVFIFPFVSRFPLLIKHSIIFEILNFYVPFTIILLSFFKTSKKIFLLYSFSTGYILFVFACFWFNGVLYQKSYILVLITIFCVWIMKNEIKVIDKLSLYALNFILFIGLICTPFVIYDEIKYPFSGGKEVALYIKRNLPRENVFIAFGNPAIYASVSAYLPDKKIYSPLTGSYISRYDFKVKDANKNAEMPEDVNYFIVDENIFDCKQPRLKIIYETDKKILTDSEKFKICKEEY